MHGEHGAGSARFGDGDAAPAGGVQQAGVVRDQDAEIGAEAKCRGEVDRNRASGESGGPEGVRRATSRPRSVTVKLSPSFTSAR